MKCAVCDTDIIDTMIYVDDLGDMAILCPDCEVTHCIMVMNIETGEEIERDG